MRSRAKTRGPRGNQAVGAAAGMGFDLHRPAAVVITAETMAKEMRRFTVSEIAGRAQDTDQPHDAIRPGGTDA